MLKAYNDSNDETSNAQQQPMRTFELYDNHRAREREQNYVLYLKMQTTHPDLFCHFCPLHVHQIIFKL